MHFFFHTLCIAHMYMKQTHFNNYVYFDVSPEVKLHELSASTVFMLWCHCVLNSGCSETRKDDINLPLPATTICLLLESCTLGSYSQVLVKHF